MTRAGRCRGERREQEPSWDTIHSAMDGLLSEADLP